MRIINRTRNTELANQAAVADSFFARMRGLLGKRELKNGSALVLKPCNAVHTFFMNFAIDVLFVDRDYKIVKLIPDLKPYRITPVYLNASFSIELPSGTARATFTLEGDFISLE